MKNLKLLSGILMLGFLVSCGGNKKEEKSCSESMQPETTIVSGDLGQCFKVVDRNYKVTGNGGWNKLITVELERTDTPLSFELTPSIEIRSYSYSMSSPFIQVGFGIEFLDEDGNVLDKVSASSSGLSGSYDPDEAVDLVKLKTGGKGSIRFSVHSAAENAMQFRISSSYKENEGYDSSSESSFSDPNVEDDEIQAVDDDDETITNSNSSSSKNWDALLDSYEQYVDKYISYMKKAVNGDMSAFSEYPALMQKAQEFSEQLENAQGDMTPTQWARYLKITQKMMNAAQSMK